MAQATFHFPRGFLWGTATASHQVEGNNTNNQWWAWEQKPGKIKNNDKSGLACDWWGGRWREDFDRAAEGGQNAHRLSIEWSRVQPAPDRWDESAIDRYREMLRGLNERNLTPMLTLHHFSDPLWLAEKGGWENASTVEKFEKFTRKVVEALKEYCTYWVTINEPNGYALNGYVLGDFPPGRHDLQAAANVTANLVRGHASAYRAIHELQPVARVGIALHYRSFLPASVRNPLDRTAAGLISKTVNAAFPNALATGVLSLAGRRFQIPEAKGTQDYFGLNYYTREYVAFNPLRVNEMYMRRFFDPKSELSSTGYLANEPLGMFDSIKWAAGFNLPIIITENGIEDHDDHLRPRYLIQHLHQAWRAANFNFPVRGYFHWSLVDNFEWERGWSQRFGLWELDTATQARRKRPSADLYAEICRENGISSEMVARYAPELFEEMFPN